MYDVTTTHLLTVKKIYHLSTCNTCQRIINELQPDQDVLLQDIKTDEIIPEQLEEMQQLSGSYESLFSKRAQLYRKQGLHEKTLNENDYKTLILGHYTFLKRPVIIINNQIFVGNSKKTVAEAKEAITV